MQRRRVLATVPVLLAGCVGTDGTDDPTPEPRVSSTETDAETDVETKTKTDAETDSPTTERQYDLMESEPISMSTEAVNEQRSARQCGGLVDEPITCPGDGGRLAVTVSPGVGSLPDATFEFTVENTANETFHWNPYDWLLQKWDGDAWRRIAPLVIPGPIDGIEPGESHTYRIEVIPQRPVTHGGYQAESEIVIGGLGPGVYGFSTTGYFESAPDEERAAGALFGLAGEGPPVRPTDAVARVTGDDAEIVVRADVPERKRETLVVSLVDSQAEAQVLPDHVRQHTALLNTLPYAATEGVETIRYVGEDVSYVSTYLSAVTPDGTTRYGFRDLTFEITVESG